VSTLPIPGLMLGSTLPAASLGAPLNATPSTSPSLAPAALANYLPAAVKNPLTGLGSFADFFRPSRLATFAVGILLIAGGIFALKPVRDVAVRAARTARRATEAAAA
jgi:hypothetical protein